MVQTFFSDPPGRPEITPGKALMTTGTEQKLTCEGKAGNPPAKLEWYRDSTMLSSQYTLEGDMVKAEVKITKINRIFFTQFRMPLPKKGDVKCLWWASQTNIRSFLFCQSFIRFNILHEKTQSICD